MSPASSRADGRGARGAPGALPLVACFVGLGGTASIVPAVLPSAMTGSPDSRAAYLLAVPATFTGLLIGVLLSSWLARRVPLATTAATGCLLQAAAVATMIGSPSSTRFVACACGGGLGFGLVEAAGSALARRRAGATTARLLGALTTAVALTAAACPLMVAFLPLPDPSSVGLAFVAVVNLAAGASVAPRSGLAGTRSTRPYPHPDAQAEVAAGDGGGSPSRRTNRHCGMLLITAVALLLYVGVEATLSGWSAVIAGALFPTGSRRAALGTSAFWVLVGAGRLTAWVTLRSHRTTPRRHLRVAACCAGALLLLSAVVPAPPEVRIALLCAAVFFLGPHYALILGAGLADLPTGRAAGVTGPLVACGATGGALMPTLASLAGWAPGERLIVGLSAGLVLLVGVLFLHPGSPGGARAPSGLAGDPAGQDDGASS